MSHSAEGGEASMRLLYQAALPGNAIPSRFFSPCDGEQSILLVELLSKGPLLFVFHIAASLH